MALPTHEDIESRRTALRARKQTVAAARGKAVLHGEPFDHNEIAAIDSELDGLDEAEAELDRRLEADSRVARRKQWEADIEAVRRLRDERVAAFHEAATAFLAIISPIRRAVEAADQATGFLRVLGLEETLLSPVNVRTRLARLLCEALQGAGGGHDFGGLNIGPRPGDNRILAAEVLIGFPETYLRRHAPVVD